MITKEDALKLHHGQTLYCKYDRNADGTPWRWRVNGKVKTWKTRPAHFEVPIKRGLYSYGYLTHNTDHLCLTEEEAMAG